LWWSHFQKGEAMALTNSLAGRNLGMILLGLWLILTGVLPLLNVKLTSTVTIGLAVLGIVAGILILLRR
jgi:pheromone shutdown protein TraB